MKKNIVIVENDADILQILQIILEAAGYEVSAFSSYNSLQELIDARPSLIILDERLDDVFGHEICKLIKTDHLTAHIPVMLLSAVSDLKNIADDCKADGFVTKPFDIKVLTQAVQKLIENPAVS